MTYLRNKKSAGRRGSGRRGWCPHVQRDTGQKRPSSASSVLRQTDGASWFAQACSVWAGNPSPRHGMSWFCQWMWRLEKNKTMNPIRQPPKQELQAALGLVSGDTPVCWPSVCLPPVLLPAAMICYSYHENFIVRHPRWCAWGSVCALCLGVLTSCLICLWINLLGFVWR